MSNFAVIKIDSNSLKLTIAKRVGEIYFSVVDELVDNINICEDARIDNSDGFLIKSSKEKEVIDKLIGYKKLYRSYNVPDNDIYVVITNVIKQAKNQQSFVSAINSALNFKAQILGSEEEHFNIYNGVINSLDEPKGLIVKAGLTATELIVYARRNIMFQKTLNFGAQSLACEIDSNANNKQIIEFTENYVKEAIKDINEIKTLEPEFCVVGTGFGSNVLTRASQNIKKYTFDETHGYLMNGRDINAVIDFLSGLDINSGKKLRGISEEPSNVAFIGTIIAKTIFEVTGLERYVNSNHSLTYNLLLQTVNESTKEKPITDILGYSLEEKRQTYSDFQGNCENVYNISMMLFKELKVLHKLPRTYVKSLRIAAYMHDSGMRINYYNHSKLSYNVILGSGIMGATHREIIVGAFIVMSENGVDLKLSELSRYRDVITEEDIDAIKKLGAIIQIAEKLDRCGHNYIKGISCDLLGDAAILKIDAGGEDIAFELKVSQSCKDDFLRAYKKSLEIL